MRPTDKNATIYTIYNKKVIAICQVVKKLRR